MDQPTSRNHFLFPLLATILTVAAGGIGGFLAAGPVTGLIAAAAAFAVGGLWLAAAAGASANEASHVRNEEILRKQMTDTAKIIEQQQASSKLLVRRDLELSRANEQLRTLDHLKSDFVTVTTHQLRTPLAAIRWTLQMIIAGDVGPITEEQKKFLMQAYESNNRLIVMLRDMLMADQIETGKLERTNAVADPTEVAQSLLEEVSKIAQAQGVSIRFNPPDKKINISIEPDHLRAVMQNLMENAVKYTPKGGTVTLEMVHGIGQVAISVADTGIGIPQTAQDRIFSRFFRAQNAVTMVTDGSGLGLFIAKRIVEHYRGTLSFTSAEGAGTTFVFTLPTVE